MLTFFAAYLLCGVVVGFVSGLFGIGGGVIGIPALLAIFTLQGMPQDTSIHMAMGTLFSTVVITSLVTIYMHHRNRMIVFPMVKKIVFGAIFGSVMGVMLSRHLHGLYLQRIFAIFLLVLAWQMLFDVEINPTHQLPSNIVILMTTIALGALSGMLGLGGGIFMIPYLNWCGVPIRNAVATTAACILPVTIVGSIGFMLSDTKLINAPAFSSGFIYWPAFIGICTTSTLFAPLGVRVNHYLSNALLKKLFAMLLIAIALWMLIK